MYLILTILKNLITSVTDDHRDSYPVKYYTYAC